MTIFMQNVLAMSSGGVPVAQNYWISLLGGSGTDSFRKVATDANGNVFVAGHTDSQGAGGSDALIAKYDANGVIQWQRVLGGSGTEDRTAVCVDPSGNAFITFASNSVGSGGYDIVSAKYDTNGTLQWQRAIGSASDEEVRGGIASDSSGNLYVVGMSNSNSLLHVVKYDTNGTLQWQKKYGDPSSYIYGEQISVDSSGNLFFVGWTAAAGGAGSTDTVIVKMNSSGTVVWQKSIGGTNVDYGYSVCVDASGNACLAGETQSLNGVDRDLFVAKFDTNGNIVWQRALSGTSSEQGFSVAADSANNIYVAGSTNSEGRGGNDGLIVKYDSSGTLQWQRTFGGNAAESVSGGALNSNAVYEGFRGVCVSDGAIYLAGSTSSAGTLGHNCFLVKVPTDGSLTGSYGHFTYRASSLTASTPSLTVNTRSLPSSDASLTPATVNLTAATATLTSTTTSLNTLPSFWINTLGGMGDEFSYGCAVDSSGNIYTHGQINSQGAGGYDVFAAKYNSSGVLQWCKTLGGTGTEEPGYGCAVDSSGNLAISFKTYSVGAGGRDGGVAKYDTNGNLLWARTIGGSGDERIDGVAFDSSGNIYAVGYTGSQGAGSNDGLIVKYNSSGTIQWQRSLGGSGAEHLLAAGCDPSGNVYVFGLTGTTGQTAGGNDILIAKYNSSGTIQWQRTLGGAASDTCYGGVVDSAGNAYLAYSTASQGAGNGDVLVAKYNTSGTLQWQRILGGAAADGASGITVDSAGNVYLTGETTSQGQGNYDALVAKYDSAGTLLWQRTLGGNGMDYFLGAGITDSGALYAVGVTTSAGSGSNDILVAKLPADGSLTGSFGNFTYKASTLTSATSTLTDAARTLTDAARTLTDAAVPVSTVVEPGYWISSLGAAGDDYPWDITTDSAGNYYVAASTTSTGGTVDGLVVKFNSTGSVLWQRSLIGASTDYAALSVSVDPSNNLYVAGFTNSQGNAYEIFVAKYNSDGAIQWQKKIGGTGDDKVFYCSTDSSGYLYLAGSTASEGAGSTDAYIAKLDGTGAIQWQRSLGGSGADAFNAVKPGSSSVYAVGSTASQGAGSNDVVLVKYDQAGTLQWQRSLGGASADSGVDVGVDSSDNVYIVGTMASQGAGGDDIFVAKYNSSGTLQWQRSLGGSGNEAGNAIKVTAAGDVFISGYTTSEGTAGEAILARYNTNGVLQWQRSVGGSASDNSESMTIDASGNIVMCINSASGSLGSNDIVLARLPSDGSCTGTYGSFTYAARTLTDAARTLTDNPRTLTDAPRTLTAANATLTDQAASLTSSRTVISNTLASNSVVVSATSQPIYWINTLGGSGSDVGYYGTIDSSGNLYVTGPVASQGAGGNDACIAKYNSSGVIQWQRTLGGAGTEETYGACTDSSGNVYITGYTASQGAGGNDAFLAKYDTNGAIQWQKLLGGSGSEIGWATACSSSGDVYMVGQTASQGAGGNDALIVKYDTNGTIQWQRSLGGSGGDVARGAAVDSSGNLYVVGFTGSQGAGSDDVFVAKYNSAGTIQWQRSLGGSLSDAGLGVVVSSSGSVYVSGYTNSQGAGGSDALIVKYDTNGTVQWQRSLGAAGNEEALGVCVDSSNNVYITGYTTSQGAGSNDILIAKYDASGTIQWQRSLGGSGTEIAYNVAVDSTGALCVFGFTMSAGSGSHDLLVARLPSDGSLTGTYGSFTYAARTLTDAARTLTASTTTLTDNPRTLTAANATLTDQVASLNVTRTAITSSFASTTQSIVTPPSYWISTLGTASAENGGANVVDSSGNVFHLTKSNSFGVYNLVLSKFNSSGAVQWSKRIVASANEDYRGLAIDSVGNLYICATTTSSGAGGNDIYVAKLDSTGSILWQKSLGGSGDDTGTDIAVDGSGNVFVCGYTNSQGAGNYDAFIAKLDSAGSVSWQRSLGGAADDRAYGVGVDASGNAYIGGYTASQVAGGTDFFVAKYSATGVIQWQRTYGGANYESGYGFFVDSSGNTYTTGLVGSGVWDILVTKYNTNGTFQWARQLAGATEELGTDVATDSLGNVYVSAYTNTSGGSGGYDIFIAKYDSAGSLLWQRALGGSGNEYPYGIFLDSQGSMYLSGQTTSAGAGSDESFIAKLPTDGSLTGTYGSFTYRTFSLTASTPSLTDAARTLTDAARTLTVGTPSFMVSDTTLTANKTTIQ